MLPRMAPSASPANSSRRITRHQSASLTSPSASARMTSVEACDPELPPLEMMSGTNSARTTAREISSSNSAHRRGGQHFAEEQRRQPAGALLDHAARTRSACTARRALPIRRCAGSLWWPSASATSSTSSIVTMPMSMPAVSVTGSARAVVLAEHGHGRLLIVGRLQRHEPAIHQVGDALVERRQQELADADVVDEQALLVDDVDDVQRFAVLAVTCGRSRAPRERSSARARDVVRRHQPADRASRDSRAA